MTRKLLLADDSVTIRRVVELTFSGEDVQVVAVSDGEEAIARIPAEKPDIVLADIGMPKRSGYDVAAFVKTHPELSHVPVLLLAGAFEPVDEARARQVRCDGVLVKPFEPQQVIARVRELIEPDRRARSARDATGTPPPAADVPPGPAERPDATLPAIDLPPPAGERPVAAAAESGVTAGPPPGGSDVPSTESEPRLPTPELGVASPASETGGLDDYFDRLDAAFATLGNSQPQPSAAGPDTPDDQSAGVPTLDEVLSESTPATPPHAAAAWRPAPPPLEPPDASPTLSPASRPAHDTDAPRANAIAEAFHVLFAVERGDADPGTVRIGPPSAPVVTDELVEQVTRRVLERLSPDAARTVVAEVVSEIAERLVREEIRRIRGSRE